MTSFLEQVDAFHRAFQYKQPTPIIPDLECRETNVLRPVLMREELRELITAMDAKDRVEMLDALCDLQYVLSGAVLAWGLRPLFEGMQRGAKADAIRDDLAHVAAMMGIIAQAESYAENNYPAFLLESLIKFQARLDTCVNAWGFASVFREAFATVHANNMAKIWSDDAVEKWMFTENEGGDRLTFEVTTGGWIARNSLGKIIKPVGFTKVSLGRFVK